MVRWEGEEVEVGGVVAFKIVTFSRNFQRLGGVLTYQNPSWVSVDSSWNMEMLHAHIALLRIAHQFLV